VLVVLWITVEKKREKKKGKEIQPYRKPSLPPNSRKGKGKFAKRRWESPQTERKVEEFPGCPAKGEEKALGTLNTSSGRPKREDDGCKSS